MSGEERERVRYHRHRASDINLNGIRYKNDVIKGIKEDKALNNNIKNILIKEANNEISTKDAIIAEINMARYTRGNSLGIRSKAKRIMGRRSSASRVRTSR